MKSIADQKLNLPASAPVMILPGGQLFPHALLPLFVFEPRYRAMLSWSLEHHRMFCLAALKPGLSEAHSTADFHHTVGLGLVRACVGHEDGTSHLVLQGFARVRISGFLQEAPFRIAEIREIDSEAGDGANHPELVAGLLKVCEEFRKHGTVLPANLGQQLASITDPTVLSDVVAHTFLRDSQRRQEVFETLSVRERTRLLIRYLREQLPNDAT